MKINQVWSFQYSLKQLKQLFAITPRGLSLCPWYWVIIFSGLGVNFGLFISFDLCHWKIWEKLKKLSTLAQKVGILKSRFLASNRLQTPEGQFLGCFELFKRFLPWPFSVFVIFLNLKFLGPKSSLISYIYSKRLQKGQNSHIFLTGITKNTKKLLNTYL